jgi:hypothetical protein
MVYHEKVRGPSGIFIRDSTNVSDLALLLFGGRLDETATTMTDERQHTQQQKQQQQQQPQQQRQQQEEAQVSMLGGYVTFSAANSNNLRLALALRSELDSLLATKSCFSSSFSAGGRGGGCGGVAFRARQSNMPSDGKKAGGMLTGRGADIREAGKEGEFLINALKLPAEEEKEQKVRLAVLSLLQSEDGYAEAQPTHLRHV